MASSTFQEALIAFPIIRVIQLFTAGPNAEGFDSTTDGSVAIAIDRDSMSQAA